MGTELISVIVPVYNVEPYLCRCVDSILRQTYRNLEIILVDDGSTDQGGKICDEYARKDPRVIVVHQENGGLSVARNTGIDRAKGEYLSFVDSDDFIDERMLEVLYADLRAAGAEVSAIEYQTFEREEELKPEENLTPMQTMTGEEAIRRVLISNGIEDFAWNKLYKKSLFDRIRYPEGRVFEDLGTTYRLLECCRTVAYRPAKLYFYYQRQDSILHRKSLKFYRDKCDMAMERYHFMQKKHPDFVENDAAALNMIQHCYPYLMQDAARRAEMDHILETLNPTALRLVCASTRRKYYLLKFSRKLYAKLFLLKNGQAVE